MSNDVPDSPPSNPKDTAVWRRDSSAWQANMEKKVENVNNQVQQLIGQVNQGFQSVKDQVAASVTPVLGYVKDVDDRVTKLETAKDEAMGAVKVVEKVAVIGWKRIAAIGGIMGLAGWLEGKTKAITKIFFGQ